MSQKNFTFRIILIALLCGWTTLATAQRKKGSESTAINPKLYENLHWRNIGPHRGGRSAAVTGVKSNPNLYYFGATGGGVWRTKDSGNTWENISDGFFGGSVGAIAVSEWDENVIYVGGGEITVRGNVSYGYGMWKSEDAGATWKNIGLQNSRHITQIAIHPKNPDIVYAAVLGDLYKSSSERGVYKSIDGGENWKKVLYANQNAGAVDIEMDPTNPRIIYASTWKIRRTPYSLESGGEGSAMWKSSDGGENWDKLENNGLPTGIWGISNVTVSPLNSNRVWAIIENKDGGVFRSDDGGKSWKKVNSDRALRQRAWYYTRIYADTQDEDMVYVVNVAYHVSKDGGKTFTKANAPHGDHHDLWIDPNNNNRMIMADDGGAQISNDQGANWTTYYNQPTAQFYRVTTDNHFPYRIYVAQQDNSAIRIKHRTDGTFLSESDWESTAGGESAHLAVDPENDDIVYGGSYGGYLSRLNHKTNESQTINVWPDNPMGYGAEGMKYRFQWNFPIFFSPHNPKKLYAASNRLHMSVNQGKSWSLISPDLTTNDATKLKSSGGPITNDNTGVEYYCTIFAAVESFHEEGVIWTGSDDGLIHVTKDGGKKWTNVTPFVLPKWTMINSLEIDPFNPGGLYVAGTRYKLGDYTPYLYKTEDYGASWKLITQGIPDDHFTRVLRADSVKRGILYAGTESGMYISFNDGAMWQPLQMNLPVVPITDLAIKENSLIATTQGRSIWMIDDVTPFHQINTSLNNAGVHLFQPKDSYRMTGGNGRTSKTQGENHPGGALIHYYIADTSQIDTLYINIIDEKEQLVTSYSNFPDKEKKELPLNITEGLNTFNWNMRYPGPDSFDGMVLWWVSMNGPMALPGTYQAELKSDKIKQRVSFKLLKDPRKSTSQEGFQKQFEFVKDAQDKISEAHRAIKNIQQAKSQINELISKIERNQVLKDQGKAIIESMEKIEKALYQTKNESPQDPLNYPIMLTNKLGHVATLVMSGDFPPSKQDIAFKNEVTLKVDQQLNLLSSILATDIPKFNSAILAARVNLILLD